MAEVTFRRAQPGDLDFLLALVTHDEVAPFLAAVRASDGESLLQEIARSEAEPEAFGRFVIEVDRQPAGLMGFERVNARSRIAQLGGLAVHPDFRGRRVADEAARPFIRHLVFELGFHRLQLEVYGFNVRGMAHADRVGFTREGVKRKAYLRDGEWVDSVLFGLVEEDLDV
jgi:L-phenylalanine/L-methionine N-acetyltransferase